MKNGVATYEEKIIERIYHFGRQRDLTERELQKTNERR